jgi:mevalonate kinase
MAHAGGKVILLGEHAVVYGVPAIAAGLERGVTASASPAPAAALRVGERSATSDDPSDLGRAFGALLDELSAPPLSVEVELSLPPGSGLGASAAIGVAVARAVLDAMAEPADPARVVAAANAWESVFHGNPSGIDVAAAAFGGCLWFSRGEGVSPIVPGRPLVLAIAVAGPPASTKSMVEAVARLRERRPEVFQKSLDGIGSLVKNAKLCIEAGDLPGLGRLMDLNQMLLSGLFVSTEGIENACRIAREAGALGAKLTGAGGGGAVIALVDRAPEPVLEAFRRAGLTCFAAEVRAR